MSLLRKPAVALMVVALAAFGVTGASAAALAAAPGTVERASNERAGDSSGAAYEVHVKKTDGTRVEVLLDSSFKVIATNAGHGGRGGPDGHHGGPNTDPAHEAAESAAQAADELTWQKAA